MKELKQDYQNENTSKDADELFGLTIATELKQLDPRRKYIAKNEIRNIFFRHQIESYDVQRNLQQSQEHFNAAFLSPTGSSTSNMSYTDMLQQHNDYF